MAALVLAVAAGLLLHHHQQLEQQSAAGPEGLLAACGSEEPCAWLLDLAAACRQHAVSMVPVMKCEPRFQRHIDAVSMACSA